MGTNKAEIIAAIQAQLTGNAGLTTHAEHEEFLHTETDSILEGGYGAAVLDSNGTETITTKNAFFNYTIRVFKNMNTITVSGNFFVVTTPTFFDVVIFSFSDSNYEGNGTGFAINDVDGSSFPITIIDEFVYHTRNVLAGETYNFSVTYNSKN